MPWVCRHCADISCRAPLHGPQERANSRGDNRINANKAERAGEGCWSDVACRVRAGSGGRTAVGVRRGIVQAGTIGYWVGQPYAHKGYMTSALRVLLPTLFGELNLHRVEAACIPSNAPSIRVLEKCGFSREGLARRYLCINGVWQDHLLFGLLSEDFRG